MSNSGEIHATSQALGRLEAQMATVLEQLGHVSEKLDKLESEHSALKNRGVGLLIGVGLLGGAAGAALKSKLLSVLGLG